MRSLIFLLPAFMGCTAIPSGSVGVVRDLGVIHEEPLEPGVHFVAPFYSQVEVYDTTFNTTTIEMSASTKDSQKTPVNVKVNWARDPEQVPMQAEKYPDIMARILVPRITEAAKTAVSQYTAEELITDRSALKESILVETATALSGTGILIGDISVDNIDFSEKFDRAVESRMQARLRAQEAREELERTRIEAEKKIAEAEGIRKAKILVAQGNAEAYRIEGEVLRGHPEVIEMQRVNRWTGDPPGTVVTSGGNSLNGVVPFMEIATGSPATPPKRAKTSMEEGVPEKP